MGIIRFQNVNKKFGKQEVLRSLSMDIQPGIKTFIIGRSGEGKSVTLKHIVGVLLPDSGEIEIDGHIMDQATEHEWIETRKKIGLLFQDGALFDSMTVAENVAFALEDHTKMKIKEINVEVEKLLGLVGLQGYEDKSPPELSIGEKKRVGLARALALKPKIILYDEPTTGMDPLVSELIDDLINDLQERLPGITSVVISHDVTSITTIADRIVFLHEGRAFFDGTVNEFKASNDPVIVQFLSGESSGPLAKPLV